MKRLIAFALTASAIALTGCAASQAPLATTPAAPLQTDTLLTGFVDPPASARPRTWWHWMNGNVTQEGIVRDLDWMARIGIGGVQNFDASLSTPQIVDERLVYMTPEWREAFRLAVSEADRRGMEFTIAASPGWSETGGPWVQPADGMKKLTWSEVVLEGGSRFNGQLPEPPATTGPFQDAPFEDELGISSADDETHVPQASGRIAVVAIPGPANDLPEPAYSLADGTDLNGAALRDARIATSIDLPLAGDMTGAIDLGYGEEVTARSVTVSVPGIAHPFRPVPILPVLQARLDGEWRDIAEVPLSAVPTTIGFEQVSASRFRLSIRPSILPDVAGLDVPAPGAESFDIFSAGDLSSVPLAELRLSAEPRLNMVEQQSGFATRLDYRMVMSGDADTVGPDLAQVIDLSDRVAADGTLDWTPPAGSQWRVYSFGWSLTGKTNHPATPEATGLEVDKLDARAVRDYLETYLGMYRETLGDDLMGKRGLRAILTDSIEVGATNWTPAMEAEFEQRRGYSLRPWLPALAGAVIGSRAETEGFLFDYRHTLADMLAENHYGTVAEVAHENGLRVYGEAIEQGRSILGDDMAMRRYADVPMAAMWTWWRGNEPRWPLLGDMRGAASVSHVYGQNLVAAESMTSANAPWAFAPRDLRRVIDYEFANGVNLPVIHTSVHVPVEDRQPGLSLMIFGQHFNRNETWAEMAGPWIDYMARNAYMLQQGRNVADVAIFMGEEAPLTAQYDEGPPDGLPRGYAFDYVNAHMLEEALQAADGSLLSTGGARYRALALGEAGRTMTLPTLRRIAQLAEAGVPIIGMRPGVTPSLADDAAEFARLADETWARANVIEERDLDMAMNQLGIQPDFELAGDAEILFAHRRLQEADFYFLTNRCNCPADIEATFRVSGKAPEWFDAVTGTSLPLSFRIEDGRTIVPLSLAAEDSGFIVFRQEATVDERSIQPQEVRQIASLGGPWSVEFQESRGAPEAAEFEALQPLNESDDPGIRYFSGITTYSSTIDADSDLLGASHVWLDVGAFGDVAEVLVNDRSAGIVWLSGQRVEIGQLLGAGENELTIKVANLWVNRLIGDKQPRAEPVTFTAAPTYRADASLRPSGLIGPVRIYASAD